LDLDGVSSHKFSRKTNMTWQMFLISRVINNRWNVREKNTKKKNRNEIALNITEKRINA